MSLFTVPGWSAPERLSGSDKPTNKKRKRTVVVEEDAKVQAATLNLEKLMKKLDTANSEPKKQQKKKNSEVLARVKSQKVYAGDIGHGSQHQKQKGQIKDPNITSDTNKSQQLRIKAKEVPKSVSKQRPKSRTPDPNGLTRLQSSMKASLEGARFR
jgi:ribosomal RNA-processing protein 8